MKPVLYLSRSSKAVEYLSSHCDHDVSLFDMECCLIDMDATVYRLTTREEMREFRVNPRCPYVVLGSYDTQNLIESFSYFIRHNY